jgi:glycyl-tRNA synthetase
MMKLGIRSDLIRFRQHQKGEMAHYANDCWDAELFTSVGWIECVGLADRSAYDLTAHSVGSGKKLQASRVLKNPEQRVFLEPVINKSFIGKTFKQQGQ